jgi:hypothetical protein
LRVRDHLDGPRDFGRDGHQADMAASGFDEAVEEGDVGR